MSHLLLHDEVREPVCTDVSQDALCCSWCGLPVSGVTGCRAENSPEGLAGVAAQKSPQPLSADAVYCCFGCRMAHAITEERGQEGAVRWTIVRLGLAIFFSMNLMAFTMTMWSLDVYEVQPDPL